MEQNVSDFHSWIVIKLWRTEYRGVKCILPSKNYFVLLVSTTVVVVYTARDAVAYSVYAVP